MNYDAWKTETPEDQAERLHTHERGATIRSERFDGFCACGTLTEYRLSGRWCCKPCQAVEIAERVTRAAR